ncbi:MAG: exodeoxyribonuclease VII small subunit [Helicobacteraceae bacterium]|jgi:exodeoxyribonuclease VII small subunit|nr:exodeoxyribonuclease VII small subunit [Helicobacteraceae bacterium]
MEKNEPSYEEHIEAVKTILNELSNPELPLTKAAELFKEGSLKLALASKLLENAKLEYEEHQNT